MISHTETINELNRNYPHGATVLVRNEDEPIEGKIAGPFQALSDGQIVVRIQAESLGLAFYSMKPLEAIFLNAASPADFIHTGEGI